MKAPGHTYTDAMGIGRSSERRLPTPVPALAHRTARPRAAGVAVVGFTSAMGHGDRLIPNHRFMGHAR